MSYRVTITPPTFATTAPLALSRVDESDLDTVSRRVSRTATLDGGAVLSDLGYSHGDRTLVVKQRQATAAEIAAAQSLCRSYPTVVVATWDGVYLGALEAVRTDNGDLVLTILVKTCLSEA